MERDDPPRLDEIQIRRLANRASYDRRGIPFGTHTRTSCDRAGGT